MARWLALEKLDGSGHQILIIVPQDGQPVIRSGYFLGTVEAFVNKDRGFGKPVLVL
jgi:hypothetical protein